MMYSNLIPGIKTELKPHQLNAVNRAIENELGLILAHDVGTGKTLTSLAIANMLGKPADVLVPASLMENYRKEIAKHSTPESVPFNLVSLKKIIDLLKKSSLNLHAFLNGFWKSMEKQSLEQTTPTTVWKDLKKNLVDVNSPYIPTKKSVGLNSPQNNFKIESTNSSNDISEGMQ